MKLARSTRLILAENTDLSNRQNYPYLGQGGGRRVDGVLILRNNTLFCRLQLSILKFL